MTSEPPTPSPPDNPPPPGLPPGAPPTPPPGPLPGPAGTPWDRREQIGWVTAIAESVRGVLFQPTDFFRQMPPAGGLGGPLLFGVIVGWLGQVINAFYQWILYVLGGARTAAEMPEQLRPFVTMLEGTGTFVTTIVFGWLFVVIGIFITSAFVHLALLLLGGARRDFEATFRVSCYAQAVSLLAVVPFCGGLVGIVWWVVAMAIGVAEAHGISRGTAAAAVLLPLLLCCCCVALAAALLAASIAGAVGALGGAS